MKIQKTVLALIAFVFVSVAVAQSTGLSQDALPILGGRIVQALLDQKDANASCAVDHRTFSQGGTYKIFIEVQVLNKKGEVYTTVSLDDRPLAGEEVTRAACVTTGHAASVTLFQAAGQEPYTVSGHD